MLAVPLTPELSLLNAVIVNVPAVVEEKRPELEIVPPVADHVTELLVALEGRTVAVNCCVPAVSIVAVDGDIVMEVTGIIVLVTVIEAVPVTLEASLAVAVIE